MPGLILFFIQWKMNHVDNYDYNISHNYYKKDNEEKKKMISNKT